MFNLTKAQAVAVGVMLGVGVAAPVLSWRLSASQDKLDAARLLDFDTSVARVVAPEIVIPEAVSMEELVVAPNHQMLAEVVISAADHEVAPAPEKRCYYHQSETLATGAVLVCDVERTESGQRGSVFAPQSKPTQLTPRDLPSPSGLIQPQ